MIINADTGKVFRVFEGKRAIMQTTFGYFGHADFAGHAYAYFAGNTLIGSGGAMSNFDTHQYSVAHGHLDLYRVDLDTGEAVIAQAGVENTDSGWILDEGGRIVARVDYDERIGEERLYTTGLEPLVRLSNPTGDSFVTARGRTPDTVVIQVVDGDKWRLSEYPLSPGAKPTPLFGDANVRGLIEDSHGLLLGGVTADETTVILFDPVRQARLDAVRRAFKAERVVLVSHTDDFSKMVVRTDGPGDSGTYFLADMTAHTVAAIAWEYPAILQDAVGPVKMVSYKAQDGLDMEGVLTFPPGSTGKNLPAVVLPHGGPEAHDDAHFDWLAQAFASRGYAVFQPNFRGSDGYGKAFRDAGFGEWGRKMQSDVSDGLAELVRQGIVDPKRVCIVGASYGGYVALAGVTLQHGLYRCAVADAPVSDLAMMVNLAENTSGASNMESRYWHRYMGAKSAGDPILRQLSPAHHAAEADAPILLIHGKQDTTVPPEQSAVMRRALNAAGKPVEFVEMVGEDHYLSKAATRTQMLEAAVAFVQKYNPAN